MIDLGFQMKVDGQEPLFVLSLVSAVIPLLIVSGFSLFLALIGIGFLSLAPPSFSSAAFAFAISILAIGVSIGLFLSQKVWSASFYEEYFKVAGKIARNKTSYDQIESVSIHTGPLAILFLSPQVYVVLRNQPGNLEFHANPKNRKLGMDLYTWLLRKTQTGEESPAPGQ